MIGIKITTLIFAILSATSITSLIMFDQNAQGQTPTLTVDYTCDENDLVNDVIFFLSGFPLGPGVITSSTPDNNIVYSFNIVVQGNLHSIPKPFFITQSLGTFTFTAFSDPNNNDILDPGEVSASTTVTISCPKPTPILTVDYTCNENNIPVGIINLNGFPEGPVSIFRFE